METLRDIRKRIASVKNTQQITKAMKMVSAAKLRKAQDRIVHFRDYADAIKATAQRVGAVVDPKAQNPETAALLTPRPEGRIAVLLISSDRGLCGGFNSNIIREVQDFIAKRQAAGTECEFSFLGRKGRDFFRKRGLKIHWEETDYLKKISYAFAIGLANEFVAAYHEQKIDALYVAYNQFVSVSLHKPVIEQIIPVSNFQSDAVEKNDSGRDWIFEPEPGKFLDELLPKYIVTGLYRSILESIAAEYSARMTAMDSATNNSRDMIDRLTLKLNRARQAAITTELMDIVNGAEAQKKK
jgi:F-type H+-transporting ATPase subunit gamma